MSEYANRDHRALGDFYVRHVSALTAENLHSKSAIAGELAFRDAEIARLRADFAALQHAIVGDTGASAIETAHRLRAGMATASRQLGEWAEAMGKTVNERDELRAALEQDAPSGWQLVPMIPTPGMLHAGWLGHDESLAARYRAMLEAAPTAQVGAEPEPVPAPWAAFVQKAHDVDGHCDVVLAADLKQFAAHPALAQREPLSEALVSRGLDDWESDMSCILSPFRAGVRFAERAHGIGTPGGTKGAALT